MFIQILSAASFLFGMPGDLGSDNLTQQQNKQAIVIQERGVARQREGQMRLYCKDEHWFFSWKNSKENELYDVEIVYFAGDKSIVLSNAAKELERKINSINNVGASCNYGEDGDEIVSHLGMLAYDKNEGVPVLIEIVLIDREPGYELYITEAE
jgi:hypothetical protein